MTTTTTTGGQDIFRTRRDNTIISSRTRRISFSFFFFFVYFFLLRFLLSILPLEKEAFRSSRERDSDRHEDRSFSSTILVPLERRSAGRSSLSRARGSIPLRERRVDGDNDDEGKVVALVSSSSFSFPFFLPYVSLFPFAFSLRNSSTHQRSRPSGYLSIARTGRRTPANERPQRASSLGGSFFSFLFFSFFQGHNERRYIQHNRRQDDNTATGSWLARNGSSSCSCH